MFRKKTPVCNCCGPVCFNKHEEIEDFIIWYCPVCGALLIDRIGDDSDYHKEILEKVIKLIMKGRKV
jgi:hypothetical protein